MKNNFKYTINRISTQIAISSITLGLLSLLLLKNNSNTGFVGIGYFLALLIVTTNSLVTPFLIVNTIRRIKDYKEHSKVLLLVLASIPIGLKYLEIV